MQEVIYSFSEITKQLIFCLFNVSHAIQPTILVVEVETNTNEIKHAYITTYVLYV